MFQRFFLFGNPPPPSVDFDPGFSYQFASIWSKSMGATYSLTQVPERQTEGVLKSGHPSACFFTPSTLACRQPPSFASAVHRNRTPPRAFRGPNAPPPHHLKGGDPAQPLPGANLHPLPTPRTPPHRPQSIPPPGLRGATRG